jgi:RHS repeat-associated protein
MTSYAYYSSPFEIGIGEGRSIAPQPPTGGVFSPPLWGGLGGAALAAVSIGSTQIGEQKAPQLQFNLFGLVPIVKQLFKKTPPVGATPPSGAGGLPQPEWFNSMAAGMKFTIYDENGTAQYSQTVDVGSIPPEDWGKLRQTYTAPISGLLEVEIFNYNINFPVYFDDWHIQLTENSKPEIVQEVHYDPWGLVMQDESYFAPASPAENSSLFNGKELQTLADLHLYDYHWRHGATFRYDPQLGRWHSPDPADQFHGLSGYAYCANNPVMLTEPDGRIVPLIVGAIIVGALVGGTVNVINNWDNIQKNGFWTGLGYFGVGAVAGAAGTAIGIAMAGATAGMGFFKGGWKGMVDAYFGEKDAYKKYTPDSWAAKNLDNPFGNAVKDGIMSVADARASGDYNPDDWFGTMTNGFVSSFIGGVIQEGYEKSFPMPNCH